MAQFRDLTDAPVSEDVEPPEVYYQQRAIAIAYQLQHDPPTDPALRARLERDLRAWRRSAVAATVDEHWDTGEGDRALF